ncbi:MAG: LacI family DNA-binding transcriptional regulator [Clostridiaceae bacterium]|nr:LacI family DNA-binding transcriptional regulator [Clostridiaceae bacterium]
MITLKDIARETGVNMTTVSKALRGAGDLNPETARRIREKAAELGYLVRERKNGVQRTVGVICPELMGSYYARIASTISTELREHGLEMLLSVSNFNTEKEERLLEAFTERNLAGIICVTESDLRRALSRIPASVPTVVIAANYSLEDRDLICVDEHAGMRRIAEYLTELGHTRIAFAGTSYGEKRLEYLNQELSLRGLKAAHNLCVSGARHSQCGYEVTSCILERLPLPTAIVAEYDDVALGVMRRLGEAGLRVPEDISVTGFDNADFCAYLPVTLTSVDSYVGELCSIAVGTLMKKLEDPSYRIVQSISVKPTIVIRDSTGKVSKQ